MDDFVPLGNVKYIEVMNRMTMDIDGPFVLGERNAVLDELLNEDPDSAKLMVELMSVAVPQFLKPIDG